MRLFVNFCYRKCSIFCFPSFSRQRYNFWTKYLFKSLNQIIVQTITELVLTFKSSAQHGSYFLAKHLLWLSSPTTWTTQTEISENRLVQQHEPGFPLQLCTLTSFIHLHLKTTYCFICLPEWILYGGKLRRVFRL